jgi:EmrB/QacA subfamily drug resistance transporter
MSGVREASRSPSRSFVDRVRSNPAHHWWVLLTVGLGTINGGIDNSIINLATPRLAQVFGVEADVILWLSAGFTVVSVGLALTWGSMGDSLGRKRVYLTGFVFFTLGLAIMSTSQGVAQLIVGRLVQAVGQSMTLSNGFAITVSAFPERDRGKVIGLIGALVGVGLTLGPIIGGYILEALDWRALFWTRLPLGIVAFLLSALIIAPHKPSGARRPFDVAGAVTLFIALTSLLLVINRAPSMGFFSPLILGLSASALIAGALFVFVERRAAMPVVNLSLFRNRFLSTSLAVHFLHFLAYIFVIFLLPYYLFDGRGLPGAQVGLLFASVQVVRLFTSPLSGWLSDRLGPVRVATAGIAVTTAGMWGLSQLGPESSVSEIALGLVLTGTGAAVFDPANEHSILRVVPAARLGSVAAMIATARQIGFSIGIAISGTLYALRLRVHETTVTGADAGQQSVSMAYGEATLVGVAIMTVAVALSMLRGPDRRALGEDGSAPDGAASAREGREGVK